MTDEEKVPFWKKKKKKREKCVNEKYIFALHKLDENGSNGYIYWAMGKTSFVVIVVAHLNGPY